MEEADSAREAHLPVFINSDVVISTFFLSMDSNLCAQQLMHLQTPKGIRGLENVFGLLESPLWNFVEQTCVN
jgi:hypothetical protein